MHFHCKIQNNSFFLKRKAKKKYRGMFETQKARRHNKFRNEWSQHLEQMQVPHGTGPGVRSKRHLLASRTFCKSPMETSQNWGHCNNVKQGTQRATYRAPEYNVPLFDGLAMAATWFFRSARKTQTLYRTIRSRFLTSFVEFRSTVSEKMSKMFQPIRGRVGLLFFRSARKSQTWKRTSRSCFLSRSV